MENILQPKPISLLETQKQVLQEALERKAKLGEIKSEYEFQQEFDYMMKKLENSPSFMRPREQAGLSDVDSYNETFRELEVDLLSLFKHLNLLEEKVNQHKRLNQSLLNGFKKRIKKAQDTLTKYERLLEIHTKEQLHFETFVDTNELETNQDYYTDHNEKAVPSEYRIKWDAEQESIKLPITSSTNALIGPGGVRLGHISIGKQLGSDLIRIQNPLHNVDKAVDTNQESFWAEQILSDSPIEVVMGDEYYNSKRGALVELNIHFDYLTIMNEFGLTMFGEYPLDVIGIQYFQSDEEDEVAQHLLHPDAELEELKPKVVEDSIVVQFPEIQAKRMKIILNQRHYIKTEFLASEKEQRNLSIWFNSKKQEDQVKKGTVFTPVLEEKRVSNQAWGKFSGQIKRSSYDIDAIIQEFEQDETKPMTKYAYTYGLYNLTLKKNEYQQTGVYVSKEIKVKGNIKTFQLETNEYHPHIDIGPLTDIEYYIYDDKTVYPILPLNQQKITCERLFPVLTKGQYKAYTRFPFTGEAVVRKNGVEIKEEIVVTDTENKVDFIEYDSSAYYTIEYTPAKEAYTINFLDKYQTSYGISPNQKTEEFRGTNSNGVVSLKHYPFIDKTKLNQQADSYDPSYLENTYLPIKIKIVDKNGNHIQQPMNEREKGMSIRNMTDYYTSNDELLLESYDLENHVFYQYQVIGNEVHFNTALPSDARIIVEYPYLVSNLRLKAILRRNIPGFSGLTPMLNEYVGHFQTLT